MLPGRSLAESIASLPLAARAKRLEELAPTETELAALAYSWKFWGRPKQFAPLGLWRTWLICAGRGFGKTRTGAEWVTEIAASQPGCRIALVGRTAADVRDVMVEGESGLMAVSPPWFKPKYEPSKRRVTWPNGSMAICYSADEPDLLRGPQHHYAWADERAAWKYDDAWDQLQFGLRLGQDPRAVVTTTPRPTKGVKELIADSNTVVTYGSTFENKGNLAPAFTEKIVKKYEGTRLGRQELNGEVLGDTPGALWTLTGIDADRVAKAPDLTRIVVAIDPSVTGTEESDECGIVVAGVGEDGDAYILDDISLQASPALWAAAGVVGYQKWEADRIVGEVNNGGEMVELTIRTVDASVPFTAVRASRGKVARAEPVAALYEQHRVHHVGAFAKLEDQLTTWDARTSTKSPDRLDALVWALTELMLGNDGGYESTGVHQTSSR